MEYLISVIIPTYNGLDYLKKCSLPSVLNQSYKNVEVIIVNDGGDASMKSFVDNIKDKVWFDIKYFEVERPAYKNAKEAWSVGGAKSRNFALDICQGQLIAPLDQDDMWCPNHLESRVNFFIKNPNTVFTYSKSVVLANKENRGTLGSELTSAIKIAYKSHSTGANYIPHLTVVYRDSLKSYRYLTQGEKPADYMLWKQMITDGVDMDFINEVQAISNWKNNGFDFLKEYYEKEYQKELIWL